MSADKQSQEAEPVVDAGGNSEDKNLVKAAYADAVARGRGDELATADGRMDAMWHFMMSDVPFTRNVSGDDDAA